jgi:hypothetical protein
MTEWNHDRRRIGPALACGLAQSRRSRTEHTGTRRMRIRSKVRGSLWINGSCVRHG